MTSTTTMVGASGSKKTPPILLGMLLVLVMMVVVGGCSPNAVEEESMASTSAATQTVPAKEATAKLKEAFAKKDETDQRLSRALTRVGPMITPKQQSSFVKAFQALPDVHAALADYQTRALALDAELTRIMSSDTELAAVMSGITERVPTGRGSFEHTIFGPKDIYDSYALLAQTPYATGALKFAVRLLAHDPKLAAIGAKDADVVEQILVPALPGTFLERLFAGGSTVDAKNATAGLLDAAGDQCKAASKWLKQYQDLTGQDLTADTIRVSGVSVSHGLRTIAGIIAIWELGGNLARGDIDAAIHSFVDGGPTAIAGVASATSLFRRVFMGIDVTPFADKLAFWSGRVGAGIGAITSVFILANDLGVWNDSVEAKVRVAGDLIAVGAAIAMLVSTGPVGPILAGVAFGIHLFADWLEGRALEEQEHRDLAACLPMTGIPQPVIDTMIEADPAVIRELSEQVKLEPEHLQWLITVDDWAVTSRGPIIPLRFIGVMVAQDIFSLDSAETYALFKAVIGNETRPERMRYMVDAFMRGMEFDMSFTGDMSKSDALAWLDREQNDEFVSDDVRDLWKMAFRNGRAYLATK